MVDTQVSATGETGNTADDIHAVPDVELLQFQKQRSTPKVSLSEVNLDGLEVVKVEVDDFGKMAASEEHMGLAKSGTEEQVIRQLHKAGSLDARAIMNDLDPADLGEPGAAEESKQ